MAIKNFPVIAKTTTGQAIAEKSIISNTTNQERN